MPVRRIKRGECPAESSGGDTPGHHRIFPGIGGGIQRNELMPDYLPVNCQCYYCQREQDEKIGSGQFLIMAKPHRISVRRRGATRSFSFWRSSSSHAVCEITRKGTTEITVCRNLHQSFFVAC